MLKKEDWILILLIIASLAAAIFFHIQSKSIEKAFQPPPRIYVTPAPSPDLEFQMKAKGP